jgi:hypothetical protein
MQQDNHGPIGWPGIAYLEHILAASKLLHGFIICQKPRRRGWLDVNARIAHRMRCRMLRRARNAAVRSGFATYALATPR